jgi:hypothetical protein
MWLDTHLIKTDASVRRATLVQQLTTAPLLSMETRPRLNAQRGTKLPAPPAAASRCVATLRDSICTPLSILWSLPLIICNAIWNSALRYVVSGKAFLLTPWSRVFLEKLTGSAASQEIPRIYVTRKFITVLTGARQLFLSWARSIRSPQPPPTSWRSHLILSSHLRLGLPNRRAMVTRSLNAAESFLRS